MKKEQLPDDPNDRSWYGMVRSCSFGRLPHPLLESMTRDCNKQVDLGPGPHINDSQRPIGLWSTCLAGCDRVYVFLYVFLTAFHCISIHMEKYQNININIYIYVDVCIYIYVYFYSCSARDTDLLQNFLGNWG